MEKCKCGAEMWWFYSETYNDYRLMYWCSECGRMFHIDHDEETWYTPSYLERSNK